MFILKLILNLIVIAIFILECFIGFTLENLIQLEEGEKKHIVAINLINGYIVRCYMFLMLLKGMGIL